MYFLGFTANTAGALKCLAQGHSHTGPGKFNPFPNKPCVLHACSVFFYVFAVQAF